MNRRTAVVAALLAAAATASWLLVDWARQEPTAGAPAPPSDPGYYLRTARILGTDTDGSALYELRAALIRQLPDDQAVMLEDIELDYALASDTPWHLRADSGWIPADGRTIEFFGDVRLHSEPAEGPQSTLLETQQLEIALHERLARTAEPVTIRAGRQTLAATGLQADLSAQRVQLESGVHGRFPGPAR